MLEAKSSWAQDFQSDAEREVVLLPKVGKHVSDDYVDVILWTPSNDDNEKEAYDTNSDCSIDSYGLYDDYEDDCDTKTDHPVDSINMAVICVPGVCSSLDPLVHGCDNEVADAAARDTTVQGALIPDFPSLDFKTAFHQCVLGK